MSQICLFQQDVPRLRHPIFFAAPFQLAISPVCGRLEGELMPTISAKAYTAPKVQNSLGPAPERVDEVSRPELEKCAQVKTVQFPHISQPAKPLSKNETKAWSGAINLARPPRQLDDFDMLG